MRLPVRREVLETSEAQDGRALVGVAFEASGQGEHGSFECRRGSQLRLERGPAGKSPQTRTRLRGEANFETHCLRGHETGGPRKGVGEPSCTMEPATW